MLVAAKSLPAGTVLKAEDVRWQRWPEEGLDPNFLVREKGADPQKVAVGFIVLHGIDAGQPVTAQRLLKPGESGFLAAALTPGMRAVTIKIDAVSAEAGFILPQDRVDIALNEHYTVTLPPGAAPPGPQISTKDVSSIILRNVKILAIDQGMQDIDSKPKVGATATLEVDLQQAQKIEIAAQLGTLSLVLRSHTLPTRAEPEGASPIVEDYQVSPFRAAVTLQHLSNLANGQQQRRCLVRGRDARLSRRRARRSQVAGAGVSARSPRPVLVLALVAALAGWWTPARSADAPTGRTLALDLGKSQVIHLARPARDVLVASPTIADVVLRTADTAFVIGRKVGETNVHFFDAEGRRDRRARRHRDVRFDRGHRRPAARAPDRGDRRVDREPGDRALGLGGLAAAGRERADRSCASSSPTTKRSSTF